MRFDLERISGELTDLPVAVAMSFDLAIAIFNDVFRMAMRAPVDEVIWTAWQDERGERWTGQIQVLARFFVASSLRAQVVACLHQGPDRRASLPEFFDTIAPLTSEMLLNNRFRREEALRRMIEWCEGRIRGETPKQSAKRLQQLDYRKTLTEFERAEEARRKEEETRLRLLREAREREEAARGWRE